MKKIFIGLLVNLFSTGLVNATTITFNEGLAAPGTHLQGTSFYESFGVSFESSLLFGFDSRLPDDGWGITNIPSVTGAVNFDSIVNSIDLTWATSLSGIDFYATAFDSSNNIIDSFFFDGGLSSNTFGVVSLAGPGITRLEYHDSGSSVAIDTLTFNASSVPEPATLALLGLGVVGIGYTRRKNCSINENG